MEAERLAKSAAQYVKDGFPEAGIRVETGGLVGYTVPQKITGKDDVSLSFRPKKPVRDCTVEIWQDGTLLVSRKYPKLLPAEMENIKLPAKKLVSGADIKVVTSVE